MKNLSLFIIFILPSLSFGVPVEGHQLMISAVSPHAIEMGRDTALKGGNVVDVSITVALTLAVTHPYFGALGGGGFALVKMGKNSVDVLDFRERAPRKTSPKFYLNKKEKASLDGGNAIAVPGIPAGIWALHKKYGKLQWSQLFNGPILLAKKGFRVSGEWVKKTNQTKNRFSSSGKKYFFKNSKVPYKPGEILKQEALAKALMAIRDHQTAPFYQGSIAQDIVTSVKNAGGVLNLKDLKDYKVQWRLPLVTEFEKHKVYLMPPPSSGGIVIKTALNLIDQLELKKLKPFSVNEFHMIGEILNRSFRGRSLLGDPDYHKNPIDSLLSKSYLTKMAKSINNNKATKLSPLKESFGQRESSETTHISILDSKGNAVSMTITLNGSYGSAIVSERYGIALNNEMDDFTTHPTKPNLFGLIQGSGNRVEPGKRPLSSMSPTLVGKDNKIVLALGAPGGPKIISAVLQTLYRLLVNGLDIDQAIQAPRVHNQFLPSTLFIDKVRFTPETIKGLTSRGHEIKQRGFIGRVYAVRKNDKRILEAAHDSRGEGASGGL